jgi:hypothetical protein
MKTYNDNSELAHKMPFNSNGLTQSTERGMRGYLINKNLCLYYWLKRRIGKKGDFRVANTFEKIILIFGREEV